MDTLGLGVRMATGASPAASEPAAASAAGAEGAPVTGARWRRLLQALFQIRHWQRLFAATGRALQDLVGAELRSQVSQHIGGVTSRRAGRHDGPR